MTLTPEDLATERATRGPGRHRLSRRNASGLRWPTDHWGKFPVPGDDPAYRGRHRAGLLGRLRRAVTR